MKSSTEESFENTWKERFIPLEIIPDERVWAKIDANLANQEIRGYKTKTLFFKMLAAASLVFAIGIGFYFTTNENQVETGVSSVGNAHEPDADPSINEPNGNQMAVIPELSDTKKKIQPVRSGLDSESGILSQYFAGEGNSSDSGPLVNFKELSTMSAKTPSLVSSAPKNPRYLSFKPSDHYQSEQLGEEISKEFWAGVDFSSGIFNPNVSYGSKEGLFSGFGNMRASDEANPAFNNQVFQLQEEPEYHPEISYKYGVSLGYQVARNWVVFSGLGYQIANSSTSVNSYIQYQESPTPFANVSASDVSYANTSGIKVVSQSEESIQLNNTFEFLSLPINAGYLFINKKIQFMVTGGLSAEILIKNKLYDPDNFLGSVENNGGAGTPYKKSYFNGMIGTNLNLPLFSSYYFNLSPSYNFGLNYLTNEESGFNTRPSSFLVTAGLKYVF